MEAEAKAQPGSIKTNNWNKTYSIRPAERDAPKGVSFAYNDVMNKFYSFRDLPEIEPDQRLFYLIISRISLAEQRTARIRLAILSFVSLASFVAIFPLFQHTSSQLAQSGFSQYFSLIFSDGAIISIYWKEFMISLAESIPLLSVTAILVSVFALLVSLKSAIKNIHPAFTAPKFI